MATKLDVAAELRKLRDSDIIPPGDEPKASELGLEVEPYHLIDMALDLIEDAKKTEDLLSDMVEQADQDTPSDYRTDHFRTAMDDCVEHLIKKGLWEQH
jgi:hypothetical protein